MAEKTQKENIKGRLKTIIDKGIAEGVKKANAVPTKTKVKIKLPDGLKRFLGGEKIQIEVKRPEWYRDDIMAKSEQNDMMKFVTGTVQVLIEFITKFFTQLSDRTFKVTKAAEDYMKPQLVVLWDAANKRPVDMNKATGSYSQNISVNGGGSPALNGLYIPLYDYLSVAYPLATREVYTFKINGATGPTVTTLTINYVDSSKEDILTVIKS